MGLNRKRADWSREAACVNVENYDETFFPKKGRPAKQPPYEKYCSICPVVYNCLAWAVVHKAEGIWGGTTKKQRDAIPDRIRQEMKAKAVENHWYEPYEELMPRAETWFPLESLSEKMVPFELEALPEFAAFEIPQQRIECDEQIVPSSLTQPEGLPKVVPAETAPIPTFALPAFEDYTLSLSFP